MNRPIHFEIPVEKDTEGHIFGAMQADATVKFNG